MIRLENVSKVFRMGQQSKVVVENANVVLPTGRAVALLGRNGAGKSTLLSMIAGTIMPSRGRIV